MRTRSGCSPTGPPRSSRPRGELHVLTYQSICQTSDPSGALRGAAEKRLVQERAATIGAAEADVQAEVAAFTGLIAELPYPTPRPRGVGAALRVRTLERSYPTILPLDRVARAIVDTYVALREIGERSGASLTLTPRAGGIVRCSMPAGNAAENARLASALDDAINPASNPRYVVSRPTWPVGARPRTVRTVVWRALTFKPPLDESWHPVPSDLGSHKDRATPYHTAWQMHVGPGQLLFAGREAAAGRQSRPPSPGELAFA